MIMQTLQFENEFFKNHGCKPAAKVFFSSNLFTTEQNLVYLMTDQK